MHTKLLSLRIRIFLAMALLVIMASVLIVSVTIYQYREQSTEYHTKRLLRKEHAINKEMAYVFKHSKDKLTAGAIDSILKSKVDEIADIHNSDIHFYTLEGKTIILSKRDKYKLRHQKISNQILQKLKKAKDHRFVVNIDENGIDIQDLFFYIYDKSNNPIAILHLPYLNNNTDSENELEEFLTRLLGVYVFLFVISIIVAYIISSYITRSLKTVSDKMVKTRLNKRNEKIKIKKASKEIYALVSAYNAMIDELEESAVKLAQSEREEAWREMAKQVAHEIKNPLTPMRLTIQSFQQRFDASSSNYQKNLDEFCNSLIEQIDTMTAVASAFSNFAKMPVGKSELINIVAVVKSALEIFTEDFIKYTSSQTDITIHFDKTQLIRIITNLVKNAIQATQFVKEPVIDINVSQTIKYIFIKVRDNGKGIKPENIAKVFEPKFTTKSSGMGLGLPIVKKIIETYKGTINFESVYEEGTEFTITLPKN